jgi:hypothetical protein
MADSSLNRRMTVRLGDAPALRRSGSSASTGRSSFEVLCLFGLRQVAPVLVCGTLAGGMVSKPDWRGNLYPAKQRPEQKIDAAVALMMALGRAMAEDTIQGDFMDVLRDPLIA